MMKTTKVFYAIGLTTLISITGCSKKDELTTLRIGASPIPHTLILEHVKPLMEEEGYNLVITEFQDYVLPNVGLTTGELDANYFQHVPYLNYYNDQHGTNIVNAGGIHLEPIGIYSKTHTNLSSLPNGTRVIMSNSVSDRGRLLAILRDSGLVTLTSGLDPYTDTISDLQSAIATNPLNLVFEDNVDAGLLVQAYNFETNAIVLINTNYALDGGLNPLVDAIALESGAQSNPYVNIIAVLEGHEEDEGIVTLVSILLSDEVQQWIREEFEGAVVPAVRPS